MCVLRIAGDNFDPERAIASISLKPRRVHRKGEPLHRSKPRGTLRKWSGLIFEVSEAEWSGLVGQVQDATEFILKHKDDLLILKSQPGVERFQLDFPLDSRFSKNIVVQLDEFSADFVALAGSVGLGLAIANYKVGVEED